MNFKNFILPIFVATSLVSCEKAVKDDALTQSPSPLKKSSLEFPYEVYEPQVSNEAQAFYEGALNLFNADSAGNYTAINKSIWIMEGSMNSFFGDSAYLNEDSIIIHESTFVFERNQDGLLNGDIVTNFTGAYQQIKALLNNNDDYTFNITDIQVTDLGSNEVSLVFRTHLLLNASSASTFAWPNVPPATVGRYAGASAECGSISGDGAWEHVQWQARQTLPSLFFPINYNFRSPRFNVVYLNSSAGSMNTRQINGDWLLGGVNALFSNHQGVTTDTTCVIPSEQDAYSQKLSDDLYDIVSKRTYWDGVSSLRVHDHGSSANLTFWTFDAILSKTIYSGFNFNSLTPCDLGIDC